jgi:type I restriction enzyme S subunit
MSGDFEQAKSRVCQSEGAYVSVRPLASSWEQRKLGGLFFESNERSSSMEILSVSVAKGIYPASESNRDTNPGASLANYKVVHKGDVVYNSMRMWQGAVGSSDYDGIVSPAYVVARPVIELDSTCFGYLLKRPEMLYKYLCDSQGNSKDTQTLKYNRFADIEVTMPVNLEEQRVISACLGRVDTLITLHQREPPHTMKEGKNVDQHQ